MKKSILSVAFFLLASSTAFPMHGRGYTTSHGPVGGGMGTPGGHSGSGGGSYGTPGAGPYDNPAQGPSAPGGYGGNYGGGGSHPGGVNSGNNGNTTGYRIGPKYGTKIPNDWKPKGKRTPIPPRDPYGGRGGYGIPTEEQKKWMDEDDARIRRENDALDEIEYKYEALMQAEKDQLPEMRALLEQSEAIIIQRSQLSEPKETTFERLRRKALAAQNVKLARDSQERVNQLIIQTNETLPQVTPQMEQAASEFIRQQLQSSQVIAQNAVDMAQSGASKSTVKLLSDFALDTAISINAFVGGVANGVYDGFMTPIQIARAIYNNPTLITNLSTNIMNTITAGPGAVAEAVHGAFQHVSNAVYQFETTMAYGTADQRGHALGEFGANVILGMAGGEAAVAARAALEGVAGTLTRTGTAEVLGAALKEGIRTSEVLSPEISAIKQSVITASSEPEIIARASQIVIRTPYEDQIVQATTQEALSARAKVVQGAQLYRIGTRGINQTGRDAQFWSLEHPLNTPNYAQKYGIPAENMRNFNFLETATVQDGNFITRPAPPFGDNLGGHIEVVVPENSPNLTIESHVTLDRGI